LQRSRFSGAAIVDEQYIVAIAERRKCARRRIGEAGAKSVAEPPGPPGPPGLKTTARCVGCFALLSMKETQIAATWLCPTRQADVFSAPEAVAGADE